MGDGSDRPACDCRTLERMAANPDTPVRWDEPTGEYHLVWTPQDGFKAEMIFYYCPFCGGCLPESKRDQLFAQITDAERERLLRLATGFASLDAVIERFGAPDYDRAAGNRTAAPEKDGEAPTVQAARVLHYTTLSATADVRFADWGRPPMAVQLIGKYVGPDRS